MDYSVMAGDSVSSTSLHTEDRKFIEKSTKDLVSER